MYYFDCYFQISRYRPPSYVSMTAAQIRDLSIKISQFLEFWRLEKTSQGFFIFILPIFRVLYPAQWISSEIFSFLKIIDATDIEGVK